MGGWFGDRYRHAEAARMGWREKKLLDQTKMPATVRDFREAYDYGNQQLYLNVVLTLKPSKKGLLSIPVEDDKLDELFKFSRVRGLVCTEFRWSLNFKHRYYLLDEFLKQSSRSLKRYSNTNPRDQQTMRRFRRNE
jgi:hypothetical protein